MTKRDEFFWLAEINKATIVINESEGLLPKDVAVKAARATRAVIEDAKDPNYARPSAYIKFEPKLLEKEGPEITIMHAGRSSQDMHATYRSAIIRDNVLEIASALHEAIAEMTAIAERHTETVVPNYTNGVAAQPNSYAHYLLAFIAGFRRDTERLHEFYKRLNLCPMGSTVLNGTSWPLNRVRMAEFLGFEAPAENAYDATQIAQADLPVEFASILSGIALHVCAFLQDLMQQYSQSRPWIILQEGGENTYVSSAMPQKRNPGLVNNCRTEASELIGEAQGALFRAHNLQSGMIDPKKQDLNDAIARRCLSTVRMFTRVLRALVINPARALEELNSDWTASQEVADVLMRKYNLPFRVGHHVASRVVGFARANNILPLAFPYAEIQRIYAEVITEEFPEGNPVLPMSEEEFRKTLDPKAIVQHRATLGGPQPSELTRMLQEAKEQNEADCNWVQNSKSAIDEALERLDTAFSHVGE